MKKKSSWTNLLYAAEYLLLFSGLFVVQNIYFYVMAFQWIGFKKEENKAHLKDFWINGVNVFWTKVCHRLLACEALSH